MCGRFALHTPISKIAKRYWDHDQAVGDMVDRFNIAPGTQIHAVCSNDSGHPDFLLSHWGFKPKWAGSSAPRPINARIESISRSRYFQEAFCLRRCVVPASGWFEWTEGPDGKHPYFITNPEMERDEALMFAAIYEYTGHGVNTCVAIITEPSCERIRHIHDRQPVLLSPDSLSEWLNPQFKSPGDLKGRIGRTPPEVLAYWRVSERVNSPSVNESSLIEPIEVAPGP